MRSSVNLHLVSDIHLEGSPYTVAPPAGTDILVAAGDIGVGLKGLQWAVSWGLPVIYVPGNHDFEGWDYTKLSDALHTEAARHKDVYVLQAESAVVQGVRFLGATLWTDFCYFGSAGQRSAMAFCQSRMPEYATAFHQKRLLRADDTLAWHTAERQWLNWALRQPYAEGTLQETVVVTHHLPHRRSVEPRFIHDMLTSAFVSDCTELHGRCGWWLHGHTHVSHDYVDEDTRFICNPRGYSRVANASQPGFDSTKLITVGAD